jgi:hypothetical protein
MPRRFEEQLNALVDSALEERIPGVGDALLGAAARIVADPDCPKCGGTGRGGTCDVVGVCTSCIRLSQRDADFRTLAS